MTKMIIYMPLNKESNEYYKGRYDCDGVRGYKGRGIA